MGSISNLSGLAWMFSVRYTRTPSRCSPSRAGSAATRPQHSMSSRSRAWAINSSSSAPEMRKRSPPHGRVEVLDLIDRQRVDAAGQVLPAVVGDHEHDVALVELARDAHGDAGDGAAGHAGEDALLVQQPA